MSDVLKLRAGVGCACVVHGKQQVLAVLSLVPLLHQMVGQYLEVI
jgi:hypothetical protein